MSWTRREFLNSAAAGTVVAGTLQVPQLLLRAAAGAAEKAPQNDNILVVVQLSGGNDGLNTVIPYGDDVYHNSRFQLRIPTEQVIRVDDYHGFHPVMKGMAELLDHEQVAILQGIGYPNPNRSHFESMDIWHTAMQKEGGRMVGWLGRWLDQEYGGQSTLGDVPGVHLGSLAQPLALSGLNVHVPSIGSLENFRLQGLEAQELRDAVRTAAQIERKSHNELLGFLHEATESALAASKKVQQAAERAQTHVEYPNSDLASKLQDVAKLIDAGLATRIYYVNLPGFDTHSQQLDAHSALLTEFSDALAAFMNDLSARSLQDRVMVMAFSEFGRRVKENASLGTDHGAAGPMFLAGGRIKSGLLGKHPSLTDLVDGDLKFHTDFRRVYATVLEDWLGSKSTPLLAGEFERLPVVKSAG